MNNLITEILKGLDYGLDVTIKVKMLIDKYSSLLSDYESLAKKHLELEARYKLLWEKTKNVR